MDVRVFAWTALVLIAGLLVVARAPRRPFEPTFLDVLFALSVAFMVSLIPLG